MEKLINYLQKNSYFYGKKDKSKFCFYIANYFTFLKILEQLKNKKILKNIDKNFDYSIWKNNYIFYRKIDKLILIQNGEYWDGK